MILSFADKETACIWEGKRVPGLPIEIQDVARRKLRILNNAYSIRDLSIPPSNKLEKLIGDLAVMYSIRINRQWRIIFKWSGEHATDVGIIHYH